jgi:hypothetical protein
MAGAGDKANPANAAPPGHPPAIAPSRFLRSRKAPTANVGSRYPKGADDPITDVNA